jgi:hypothetical protein
MDLSIYKNIFYLLLKTMKTHLAFDLSHDSLRLKYWPMFDKMLIFNGFIHLKNYLMLDELLKKAIFFFRIVNFFVSLWDKSETLILISYEKNKTDINTIAYKLDFCLLPL